MKRNDKIVLFEDKFECCGCSACYSICPVNAINMVQDEEGFLYPLIFDDKCIRCKACVSVCVFKDMASKK